MTTSELATKIKIEEAIALFKKEKTIALLEPCTADCPEFFHLHEEIYLDDDGHSIAARFSTTCPIAPWEDWHILEGPDEAEEIISDRWEWIL